MFDFEKALLHESMRLPTHEASAFFLEIRSPIKTASVRVGMMKTAGWEDPPDDLGLLEGQFEVPVPQALLLMGNCAMHFMRLLNAGSIYPNSIRGPYAGDVKGCITCNEWDHKRALDYVIERMTVLAGAPHIPDVDMPPPCTDPIEAARKMIRAEQECIHALHELSCVLGCNPMKDKVKEFSGKCQEHLDKYWMTLPPDLGNKGMLPQPPVRLQRHEANETPEMESAESPEFQEAEESAGVEPPEHEAAEVPVEQEVTAHVKVASIQRVVSAMVKWAKEAPTDEELRESGRQSAVKTIAAEHGRERARRGERAGKVLGALSGIAAGGAAGKKLVGGKAGTLGGAVIGGLAGRSLGSELGTEADIARGKMASALGPSILSKLAQEPPRKKGLGERIGGLGGAVLGGAGGGTAGLLAGTPGGPAALALGAGGMTAGSLAGEALGSRLGRAIDEKGGENVSNFGRWLYNPDAYHPSPEVSKVASAMVAWVKTAQGLHMEAEAPMASPTDSPELEPLNYMQAEQLGRQAQEMNEANYHKARAAKAEMAASQVIQQVQQEAGQQVQQAQQAMAEAQGAEQKAQEMMGVAMQAKDQAVQQTETAARIRMANQDLRMKLMEIASQEPDMAAAMSLAQATSQAPLASPAAGEAAAAQAAEPPVAPPAASSPSKAQKEVDEAGRAQDDATIQGMQAEHATGGGGAAPPEPGMTVQASADSPEAFIFGMPDPEGPVGKAPQPRTAPGAAPAAGAPDMNEDASGPIGPEGQLAVPSTFFKTAGPLGFFIGAPLGASAAAFSAESSRRQGLAPAQQKVDQLMSSQDGTWGQAAALARAQKNLADRQLQQVSPGRYMAGQALSGAYRGGVGASALEDNLRYLFK